MDQRVKTDGQKLKEVFYIRVNYYPQSEIVYNGNANNSTAGKGYVILKGYLMAEHKYYKLENIDYLNDTYELHTYTSYEIVNEVEKRPIYARFDRFNLTNSHEAKIIFDTIEEAQEFYEKNKESFELSAIV